MFLTLYTVKFSVAFWAYIFPLSAASALMMCKYFDSPTVFWKIAAFVAGFVACLAMLVVFVTMTRSLLVGETPSNPKVLQLYVAALGLQQERRNNRRSNSSSSSGRGWYKRRRRRRKRERVICNVMGKEEDKKKKDDVEKVMDRMDCPSSTGNGQNTCVAAVVESGKCGSVVVDVDYDDDYCYNEDHHEDDNGGGGKGIGPLKNDKVGSDNDGRTCAGTSNKAYNNKNNSETQYESTRDSNCEITVTATTGRDNSRTSAPSSSTTGGGGGRHARTTMRAGSGIGGTD